MLRATFERNARSEKLLLNSRECVPVNHVLPQEGETLKTYLKTIMKYK